MFDNKIYGIIILLVILISCLVVLTLISQKSKSLLIMEEENFTVILSNKMRLTSPLESDNSPAYFYTYLPSKLDLNSDYEVGLAEISFQHSWNNIEDEEFIGFTMNHNTDIVLPLEKAEIKSGYYISIDSLLYELNTKLKSIKFNDDNYGVVHYPQFYLNPIDNNKLIFKIGKIANFSKDSFEFVIPDLSDKVWKLLGFDNTINVEYDEFTKFNEATVDYDLITVKSVDVHCDIIQTNISGNEKNDIMTNIQIPKNKVNGNQILSSFDAIKFYKLKYYEIDHILISITDERGREIKFHPTSETIATLMFEKKNKHVYKY